MKILPKVWPSVSSRGLEEILRERLDDVREKGGPYVACLSAEVDQTQQADGAVTVLAAVLAVVFDAATLKTHLDAHTPAVQLTAEETGIFGVPIRGAKAVEVDLRR